MLFCRCLDLDAEGLNVSWKPLIQVSEHLNADASNLLCIMQLQQLQFQSPVSFVMTLAHVLRLVLIPEPEKVNPLVLPWQ